MKWPRPIVAGLDVLNRAGSPSALFLDVIEHLVPRPAVLSEIRRVLRPGGRMIVSGPNRETTWRRLRDHRIEYTEPEFLAELRACGFVTRLPVGPIVYDTPWAGMIDAIGGISLGLYSRLSRWKREAAVREPGESTGFRVVALKLE
jgi:SAM-dependent methyltransferase